MRRNRCLGYNQFLKLQGDKNEGGKVNGHYTTKTWILRAIKSVIVTTTDELF